MWWEIKKLTMCEIIEKKTLKLLKKVNLALKKKLCDYKVEVVFLIKPYVLYFRTAVFLWIPRVLNQSEDFGMFKLHIYMSMNVMNFLRLHYFICCSIWLHFSDEWILIFSMWKIDFNLATTCALLCKMLWFIMICIV